MSEGARRREKETRRSAIPTLDDATIEAVVSYRDALRMVKRLEREDVRNASPIQRGIHTRSLDAARRALREARLGLDSLLQEDA